MRVFLTLCAAALVGCADLRNPTEAPNRSQSPQHPRSLPVTPLPPRLPIGTAPMPVLDYLQQTLGRGVARVTLPPDDYSLSTEAVHPDIACPSEPWNGNRCWLMYTPYRNGDWHYENPSVLLASSDTEWATPAHFHNPLIPFPGGTSYNSDPDQAFDPVTGRMVQVFRVVDDSMNNIMLMSTRDARQWTKPVLAFREPNHNAISPSLVLEPNGLARLWYVSAGTAGCRASSATVKLRTAQPDSARRYEGASWSAPTSVSLAIPNYVPWHLDVMELGVGGGYIALVAAYPARLTCGNSDLWFAWSTDGVRWTVPPVPLLWRTMDAASTRNLASWYRGTMRYDALTDRLDLWPSALAASGWAIYHTSTKLATLMAELQSAKPGDFQASMLARTNRLQNFVMP